LEKNSSSITNNLGESKKMKKKDIKKKLCYIPQETDIDSNKKKKNLLLFITTNLSKNLLL